MTKYDYDLFTIGAGSGGVRATRLAATYGARAAVASLDAAMPQEAMYAAAPAVMEEKAAQFTGAVIETGGDAYKALSVPDSAILLLQGQPTVFVAEHGGYEARPVELGEKLGGRTVIKSGVAAGDKLVAAGAYALKARLLKSQISDEH